MKLPDFFKFEPLNKLKERMGIAADVYGPFTPNIEPARLIEIERLTETERNHLDSGEGIDVSFDELTILEDGTLAYKDTRVLLYIRDWHIIEGQLRERRYHVSNCTTLQQMTENGRFDRYVIAAEVTGVFKVNIISDGNCKPERRRLSVCQYCLDSLAFDGFSFQWPRKKKGDFVGKFTPDRFFRSIPNLFTSRHRPTIPTMLHSMTTPLIGKR
jgi:hypothetical protein